MDQRRPRPVFVSTDPGGDPDDYWLLAHLAVATELEMRGVVTNLNVAAGPESSQYTAANALLVFRQGLADRMPEIVAGAATPLDGPELPREAELRGARFLLAESRGFHRANRLPVLVTGPATDVALALLLDPDVAHRIEIIAIGFESWPAGGDPWNVRSDVRAWQIVLASSTPLVVGDCQVAARDLRMDRALARELCTGRAQIGRFLDRKHRIGCVSSPRPVSTRPARLDAGRSGTKSRSPICWE